MKLIVCDVDGTIINADEHLSQEFIDVVTDLRNQGIYTTLATGRTLKSAKPFVESLQIDIPFIISNGACVMQGEECLYAESFSIAPILDIIRQADQMGITITISDVYSERPVRVNDYVKQQREEWGRLTGLLDLNDTDTVNGQYQKVMFYDQERAHKIDNILPLLEPYGDAFAITTYTNKAIELAPANCNKATGIAKLVQLMKIPISEVMACGDYVNDVEMVAEAGIGVAVANALPSVKEKAKYVTQAPGVEGVMEAIRKFILEE